MAERRRPAGTPSEQYGALVPEFAGWLVENAVCPPNRLEPLVVSVANSIDALSQSSTGFAATHWRSRDVDHLLERVLTSDLVEDDDETRAHIAGDVTAFLRFLEATNRWTGTDDDLGYGLSTLVSYIESKLASLPPVDESPVEPEAERAALTALPVVARLDALLGWIGERRPVTATGALKRALVMEAFDAVGGKREDLAPRKVQSMWDIPVLAQTWVVAAMLDLISIGKTVVKPGPAAPVWRDPDRNPGEYLTLCRDAVTHSLVVALGRRGEGRLVAFHSVLDEATAAVLSAGLGEHPCRPAPRNACTHCPCCSPACRSDRVFSAACSSTASTTSSPTASSTTRTATACRRLSVLPCGPPCASSSATRHPSPSTRPRGVPCESRCATASLRCGDGWWSTIP
ncbi:hypothetical protein ACFQZK_27215 [Rhodococcus aetherivorans]